MGVIRFGLAQLNATVGDFAGNLDKLVDALDQGRQAAGDVMLFPELFLCGYPPEDLLLKQYFLDENGKAIAAAARACRGIEAVVGYSRQSRGQVFNAAAWLAHGKIAGIYHKIKLPNYGVFDERRYFKPGKSYVVCDRGGMRMGLTVCEDIWVVPGPAEREVSYGGARLILNLSASPFHAGKSETREHLIRDLARRTGAWVLYCNLVGGQDELLFDGRSMAVNPQGELLLQGPHCAEEIMWLDVDERDLVSQLPTSACGPGCKVILLENVRLREHQPIRTGMAPRPGEVEEIYQALVLGTGDYVRKNGFKNVVLGISGGIDSAIVAAVAADALGPDHVFAVSMPSRFTSDGTRSDAEILARNLGIKLYTVPIEPMLNAYVSSLFPAVDSGPKGLTAENLQARIRGALLMAMSNQFGWMVLNTGNKSETAVGYSTLYGDMVGGFAVIKDVPKTMVYRLAELVNKKAGKEIIPHSIIERAPTAELRANQKDQDDIPDYDTLDKIVHGYVEEDMSYKDLLAAGLPQEAVDDVIRRIDQNEYKRRQAAPGVKITPKAFGKDRRVPITVRFSPVRKA